MDFAAATLLARFADLVLGEDGGWAWGGGRTAKLQLLQWKIHEGYKHIYAIYVYIHVISLYTYMCMYINLHIYKYIQIVFVYIYIFVELFIII